MRDSLIKFLSKCLPGLFGILIFSLVWPCSAQDIYWGEPEVMEKEGIRFPQAVSGDNLVLVVWQEFIAQEIYLSLKRTEDMRHWDTQRRFAGPFSHKGKQVPIFSLQVNEKGFIVLAIASHEKQTTFLFSGDKGKTFQKTSLASNVTTVSPKLFIKHDGNLLLFVSHDAQDSLNLYYTEIDPGNLDNSSLTASLLPFVPEQPLVLTFLPHHTTFKRKEYVIYQSQDTGKDEPYQLYLKISDDQGKFLTTSPAIKLTALPEERDGQPLNSEYFDNQRPFLYALKDKLIVTWERSYRNEPAQIYYAELDENGDFWQDKGSTKETVTTSSGTVANTALAPFVKVTNNRYNCFYPTAFEFKDQVYLLWFDNRRGDNHVIMAEREGQMWREQDLCRGLTGSSIYPWHTEIKGYLSLFWENQTGDKTRLIALAPDQSVGAPQIYAGNFSAGYPNQNTQVRLRWSIPDDPSGIAGYNYTWSQNSKPRLTKKLMLRPDEQTLSLQANKDGDWYFHIIAMDNAGNWSEPASIHFLKDTAPPASVTFAKPEQDEQGFLLNNNPRLSWEPGKPATKTRTKDEEDAEVIAGYSYLLEWLGGDPAATLPSAMVRSTPSKRVLTQSNTKSYINLENGLWAFQAVAFDLAGNTSPAEVVYLRLNKFKPFTVISHVRAEGTDTGESDLRIYGRGFTAEGTIHSLVLDKDKQSPYDFTFYLTKSDYKVLDDRTITGPFIKEYEEGRYFIGLNHNQRGLYFGPEPITLQAYGTVKLGDYTPARLPPWEKGPKYWYIFTADTALAFFTILFLTIFMLAAFRRLLNIVRESQSLKFEAYSVINTVIKGQYTIQQKESKMKEIRTKGIGLRLKFTLLITSLVIMIVLIVSIPLSLNMIQTQRRNLATGLWQRAKVLLGSLSAGSEEFLLDQDTLALSLLTNQISAMPEAKFAIVSSIMPLGSNVPGKDTEYVWGVNKEDYLAGRITNEYVPGRSIIKDEVNAVLKELAQRINTNAATEVTELVQELGHLYKELQTLLGKTDERSLVKIEEVGKATASLETSINLKLRNIAFEVNTVPEFDINDLQKEYTFYMPIVYRSEGQDIFFRGLVRLGVSAEVILTEIETSRFTLIITISIIAIIAMLMGTLGALLLAFITISPIKKLVAGVAMIRDTEDKEELKDHIIRIKQRDEIRMLADTINQMTQGLVKAAAANKELTIGKEVQKMFIPLDKDAKGQKGTIGAEKTKQVDIFGYYEGAKGVSGDYFDYKKLDDKHYAIIKCDIAGKGVSASLIMVEVATLFMSYFRNWTIKNPGLKIDKLVYTINDMLEERGFKGRFAALTICIFNTETGDVYFCNAGDNIVHIYKEHLRQMVEEHLPKAPAAGVFPSFMVESQGGFAQVKKTLQKGDTLLLFTDGIEESQHSFRDEDFKPVTCEEPGLKDGEIHVETHVKGSAFEELGIPRINAIINSVFNKQTYKLIKHHNPIPEEELVFDFRKCQGNTREVVLALAAVEKIFRIYKKPTASADDIIIIDKHVDAFLKETFKPYHLYFSHPVEKKDESAYAYYAYLNEDSQYDDLTILGIRKE